MTCSPAKHLVLACLGETVWQAQRHGTAPDEKIYSSVWNGRLVLDLQSAFLRVEIGKVGDIAV